MRIALVHSYYSSRQPSGENVVVDTQAAALSEAGHEVRVVARRTDAEERRSLHSVRAAWTVATGVGADPTEELRAFRPDVVHVHNLFPNFGTSWLARWDGPVVATLHNFRPDVRSRDASARWLDVHARARTAHPASALRHGCYRGSRIATLPLAVAQRSGPAEHPVVRRADMLMTLSSEWAATYERYGVDHDRIRVVPNFVRDPRRGLADSTGEADGWLFVGRMTSEKGLVELLRVWPDHVATRCDWRRAAAAGRGTSRARICAVPRSHGQRTPEAEHAPLPRTGGAEPMVRGCPPPGVPRGTRRSVACAGARGQRDRDGHR